MSADLHHGVNVNWPAPASPPTQRLQAVRQAMQAAGLNQLLVTATASVYYLTGLWIEPQERLLALYVDADSATLCANALFGLAESSGLTLISHQDGQPPVADLAQLVRSGPLGIDKGWPSRFLIDLLTLRPDVVPVHGSGPVDQARMLKDPTEQARLQANSAINDQVMGQAIQALSGGVREHETAALINRLFLQAGADREGTQVVCFGANGADPHHSPDNTSLQAGDSVVLDLFTPIGHYWCDMTRTVFYKRVSAEQRAVYACVKAANERAISLVRPGVLLSDLDRAARQVIDQAGYGPYFIHRLGHGIGLECHEPPDVGSQSAIQAQPGMIFSIEPGVYLPGAFGVRIEDLVLVTADGCQVLNDYPKDLQVIEAG